MRILFVGLDDHNGWMYEYSRLINQHTEDISNCILYRDIPGYGADIVLKSKKDMLCIDDKLALVDAFAKETDIFIFNGCDPQIADFKYGRTDWKKYIKNKKLYFFVGDFCNVDSLFCSMPNVSAITNQPRVYVDFCNDNLRTLSLIQPLLSSGPTVCDVLDKKIHSFLYRDEGGIKNGSNFEAFLMIFSFVFNEFDNVNYVSWKGQEYDNIISTLSNFTYSFDMMTPVGIYSRASIEAACCGLINFVAMPYPYEQLFLEMIESKEFYFDSVVNEKELYEKSKAYILDEQSRKRKQENIKKWATQNFLSNRVDRILQIIKNEI